MPLRLFLIAAALLLPATALLAQTNGIGDRREPLRAQLAPAGQLSLAEQIAEAEQAVRNAQETLKEAKTRPGFLVSVERAQIRLKFYQRRLDQLRRQAAAESPAQQGLAQPPLAVPQPPVVIPPSPAVIPPPQIGRQPRAEPESRAETTERQRRRGPVADTPDGQIVKRSDDRVIVKTEDDQVIIRHDESRRFRKGAVKVDERKRPDGSVITEITRANGSKIITVTGPNGEIIRRVRRTPEGEVVVLVAGPEDVKEPRAPARQAPQVRPDIRFGSDRPPIGVPVPRDRYIVESRRATPQIIEEALIAPPVERVERAYTLDEIRYSRRLRDKLWRVELDTITFGFGSAEVAWDQVDALETIGRAMERVIYDYPDTVFLVEGHTDAVGSDFANLELSDRRAESVAIILTDYFAIPPENLITQGYGEQFLKVWTQAPERQNRRVTIRNLTPLLQGRFAR